MHVCLSWASLSANVFACALGHKEANTMKSCAAFEQFASARDVHRFALAYCTWVSSVAREIREQGVVHC